MGLAESLNTEQAIVSSLQHNDLIKLHLEQHVRHWQKTKCCWKHNAAVLYAPAHLLTRLAVMLRLCAGANANCSLRGLAALFAVISVCKGHFSSVESLSLREAEPGLNLYHQRKVFVILKFQRRWNSIVQLHRCIKFSFGPNPTHTKIFFFLPVCYENLLYIAASLTGC